MATDCTADPRPPSFAVPFQEGNLTLTYAPNDKPGQLGPTETMEAPASELGLDWFDFRFLGEPLQCTDPTACGKFKKVRTFRLITRA